MPCRQNPQSKMQTYLNKYGQFLQVFAGTACFVHGKNIIFGAGEKSRCNQDTKDKQPEILDAEGKPIAVQTESAK